ncbi:MAG: hypothetical protein IPM21_00955 [Acidobacteria bacterium]|nr:hypothetical protein [Acidobacteriota bacterium]
MKAIVANVIFLILVSTAGSVVAQFPIKMPKIPKVEKPKADQPKTESRGKENDQAAPVEQSETSTYSTPSGKQPYGFIRTTANVLFVRDSVYIQAETGKEYWKSPGKGISSWVPKVQFTVFYDYKAELPYVAEYTNPDGSVWFSEPLELGNRAADLTVMVKSNRDVTTQMVKTKSTIATGIYGIKITNSASGEIAFQGKFKVGKFPIEFSRETRNEYYVDHDWLMPIGYVSFHFSNFIGEDLGVNFPIQVGMWFKKSLGSTDHGLEGRLFYQGQQLATTKPNEREDRASAFAVNSPDLHHWRLWEFQWSSKSDREIHVDNGGEYHRDNMPKAFFIDKNPGEYTVKAYHNGTQVREAKFTVGADGKIVDGGYQKPGYLTYHKVLIPVTIIGTSEKWNATAWKTEAFYGNPMKGFLATEN